MTCKQLGGACDQKFTANTWEEMVAQSKAHGMEMYEKKDQAHFAAMQQVQQMMNNPEEMQKWFVAKRMEFEALPED